MHPSRQTKNSRERLPNINSGQAGYGGICRDFRGGVPGAFCLNFNMASSVAAEVMTVIKAIELA